jgi:hypothetical protein
MKGLVKVTLGADPEFFIKNIKTNDITPICGLLGGTKHEPVQMRDMPAGFMHQEDGAAAEINVPVCQTPEQLLECINLGRAWVDRALLPKGFVTTSAGTISIEKFVGKFPQLRIVGCDPDYWAWAKTGPDCERPMPDIQYQRGAGAHIHFGHPKTTIPSYALTRIVDMVSYAHWGWDRSFPMENRKWGLYRPKPYGFEYRSPGIVDLYKPSFLAWLRDAQLMVRVCATYPAESLDLFNKWSVQYDGRRLAQLGHTSMLASNQLDKFLAPHRAPSLRSFEEPKRRTEQL